MSPLRCPYPHRTEIEAVVHDAARDTAFDTLCAAPSTCGIKHLKEHIVLSDRT